MRDDLINLGFLLGRYLHIIAATMIVGGTLFYELIVPVAIDELKDPQKLSVFARARWAFRWIVWCSAVAILVTGGISTYRNWYAYNGVEASLTYWGDNADATGSGSQQHPTLELAGAGKWWLAHALGGLAAIVIALALVRGRTPPRYPLVWMRIILLMLLVVIFLASTARHVRLHLIESR